MTGAALSGISIDVRDFNSETLHARTTTDTNGDCCINVPLKDDKDPVSGQVSDSESIVGTINRSTTSFAASEWWTLTGNGYERVKGDKISVTSQAAIKSDFTLEPGARISVPVNAFDVNQTLINVPGVDAAILDSITHFKLAEQVAQFDGSFQINVFPGKYIVAARYGTYRLYASQIYTDVGGSNMRNYDTVLSLDGAKTSQLTLH